MAYLYIVTTFLMLITANSLHGLRYFKDAEFILDSLNEVSNHENKWGPIAEKLLYRQLLTNTGSPVCTSPYYTSEIQSNATAGSFITRVTATDPNGLNLTYTITDTSLQRFTINPNTGDIFTSTNLSRIFPMPRSVMEFLVRATNSLNLYCESVVRVSILTTPIAQTIITVFNGSAQSVASTGPSFSQSQYYCSTNNCALGATICTVSASGATSYLFPSTSTSNNNNPFTINSQGVIRFIGSNNAIVSANTNNSYTLQANDASGHSATTTVFIYSTCNFNGGLYFLPTINGNGNGCGCVGLQCVIGSYYASGSCTNANTINNVVVTSAPVFDNTAYTFNAGACGVGSTVGQIIASNTPTSFAITGNNDFAISNTGVITLPVAMTAGTQSFVVTATNSAGSANTLATVNLNCNGGGGPVNVNVNGNNVPIGSYGTTVAGAPVFSQSAYSVTISNCGVGSVVGKLAVSGADTFAVINSGGTPPGYGIDYKGVIRITGTPTPGATQTLLVEAFNGLGSAFASVAITALCAGGFPYPTGTNLPPLAAGALAVGPGGLPVAVSGGAGPVPVATGPVGPAAVYGPPVGGVGIAAPLPAAAAVAVPQAVAMPAPQPAGFSTTSYTFSLQSCNSGAPVGTVSAGGGATYSITGGGAGFSINPNTGQIIVSGDVNPGTQAFLVQATTPGGNSFATVTVSANCGGGGGGGGGGDFSQRSYTFFPTACGPNVIIGTVYSRGRDVKYSTNGLPYWTVDPSTGIISSVTSVPSYSTFVVTAQSGSRTSTVTVTASSACPDYFAYSVTSCQPNSVVVPGNAISGIAGGAVSSFTLSGPQSNLFSLNSQSGAITSTAQLTSGTYAYVLTASLSGGGTYTAFITLMVSCGGASISFVQPTYSYSISCGPMPQRVGVVLAQATNGESITYSLGAVNHLFYIDPSSGEIRTQVGLRREGRHAFTVSALGASGASSTANVFISVSGDCQNRN